MRRPLAVFALVLAAPLITAQREPILVPEVSQSRIEVRQGFTGANLLLYGAVIAPAGTAEKYDIVVVLKGPTQAIRIREKERLATLSRCRAALVLVGEEVGWGVIPATAAGCRFQARLTALQLQIAGQCDAHWLVVGGRALDLRRLGEAVPAEL